jgi:hypothetical protein
VLVAVGSLSVLSPDNPDPVTFPAEPLWSFRLLSLTAAVALWTGLGVVFGPAGVRAQRSRQDRSSPAYA